MKLSPDVLKKMDGGSIVHAPDRRITSVGHSLVVVKVDHEQGVLVCVQAARLLLQPTKKRLPSGWIARKPTTVPLEVGAIVYRGAAGSPQFVINELGDNYALVSRVIILTPENWEGWEWIAKPQSTFGKELHEL